MRRGMGLADIMLYLFLLFLIGLTVVIAGVPNLFTGVTVTIDSDVALRETRSVVAERSVSEGLTLMSSVFAEPGLSGHEVIASYVSYVYADSARSRLRLPYIGRVDEAPSQLTIRPSVHDTIRAAAPNRRDTVATPLSFNADGTDFFRAGIVESGGERNTVRWVPGYVGPEPHARAFQITYTLPLEVWFDES